MTSIFLSYSHKDMAFVKRIAHDLEQNGHVVWLDEASLAAGELLVDRITEAIDKHEIFISILSQKSLNSSWVLKELDIALEFQELHGGNKVIPLLIDDVEPPESLQNLKCADFRSSIHYREALGALLAAIAKHNPKSHMAADKLPLPGTPYYQPGTIEFLSWLYGDEALLRSSQGETYPISVAELDIDLPDSILGPFTAEKESRHFPYGSPYLDYLKRESRSLWNGRTFILQDLNWEDGAPRLTCSEGRYFDAINTCDILEDELTQALLSYHRQRKPLPAPDVLYKELPLRYATHNGATGEEALQCAWSCKKTSAAVAVSTLLVVNDHDQYKYYVRRRSKSVAVHAGLYHTVPSFMFQPTTRPEDMLNEYSIVHNVIREFTEEVFSEGAAVGSETVADQYDHFYPMPQVMSLLDLLNSGAAELVVTGLGMNLLNLRPEVLTLLVIHDPEWFSDHHEKIRFCQEEFEPDVPGLAPNKDFMSSIPIEDSSILRPGGQFSAINCVAPGAACLVLGLPRALSVTTRYNKDSNEH